MPRTAEDVETYLLELNRRFEKTADSTYLVSTGSDGPPIVVFVAPPIVAIRMTVGPVPTDPAHQLKLFDLLLRFNASDLMYAAYGVADHTVSLSAALPLENLDRNELEAALSDIDLALMRHVSTLHDAAKV